MFIYFLFIIIDIFYRDIGTPNYKRIDLTKLLPVLIICFVLNYYVHSEIDQHFYCYSLRETETLSTGINNCCFNEQIENNDWM